MDRSHAITRAMSDARPAAGATKRVWRTEGFEAFRRGTFGNAGHNLYVSRAGVLQRIHQYDINHDGYVDLLFCNSQDHLEIPPAYVYRFTPAGIERAEVPLQGAAGAAVADLNGDGRPEFIVGGWYDGVSWTTNATLYYGSDRGWGEHAVQYLPAPLCLDVAAGDYDGDGRPDLAFQLYASLRIYYQTDLAFEPKRFVDLKVAGSYIDAADLDGDGRDELIVRDRRGRVTIYWGGADGLNVERCSVIDVACDDDTAIPDEPQIGPDGLPLSPEWRENAYPRVQVVKIRGVPHVFAAGKQAAWFVPCRPDRTFGEPWSLPCVQPMAVAVADLEGDGGEDLILAAREQAGDEEVSAVFWDEGGAYEPARRTLLPTLAVTDVTVGDYDGDGRLEIAFAAGHTENAFDCRSRIYRVNQRQPQLAFEVDVMDAQRVFSVREEGRDALVVLNQQGRSKLGNIDVSIYLGGADGFRPDRRIDVPAWGATVAVCADFNDDGRVDLAIANTAENSIDHDPGSYVYFQREDGFRSQPDLVLPTRRSHGIACADLNRDGYLDLVFAGFQNDELLIFYGREGGFDTDRPFRLKLERDGKTYSEVRFIQLADLNGDGWLDLILPLIDQDHSLILWGGPNGFRMDRCQVLSAWHVCSASVADLDGNGYPDLLLGGHAASPEGPHDSFVYIYWNGPDGLREDRRTLLPAEAVNSMSVADFNNDGRLDLFVGSYHDGRKRRDIDSFIYWNRKGRGFSARDFTRLFNHSASGDFAADFNEDGWIDLAVANHKRYGDHMGESRVWWNGPEGFDEKRITRLPTAGPHGMVAPGPGNQMDRGWEEYYTSEPYEGVEGQHIVRMAWDADLPPKTWLRAQVRSASTREELEQAPWQGPSGPATWFENSGESIRLGVGRWLQYRLALGSLNSGGTPRVRSVDIEME